MRKLHDMPVEKRVQMGASGREAYLGNYTRKRLMDRYEILLAEIAKKGRSGKNVKEEKGDVGQ